MKDTNIHKKYSINTNYTLITEIENYKFGENIKIFNNYHNLNKLKNIKNFSNVLKDQIYTKGASNKDNNILSKNTNDKKEISITNNIEEIKNSYNINYKSVIKNPFYIPSNNIELFYINMNKKKDNLKKSLKKKYGSIVSHYMSQNYSKNVTLSNNNKTDRISEFLTIENDNKFNNNQNYKDKFTKNIDLSLNINNNNNNNNNISKSTCNKKYNNHSLDNKTEDNRLNMIQISRNFENNYSIKKYISNINNIKKFNFLYNLKKEEEVKLKNKIQLNKEENIYSSKLYKFWIDFNNNYLKKFISNVEIIKKYKSKECFNLNLLEDRKIIINNEINTYKNKLLKLKELLTEYNEYKLFIISVKEGICNIQKNATFNKFANINHLVIKNCNDKKNIIYNQSNTNNFITNKNIKLKENFYNLINTDSYNILLKIKDTDNNYNTNTYKSSKTQNKLYLFNKEHDKKLRILNYLKSTSCNDIYTNYNDFLEDYSNYQSNIFKMLDQYNLNSKILNSYNNEIEIQNKINSNDSYNYFKKISTCEKEIEKLKIKNNVLKNKLNILKSNNNNHTDLFNKKNIDPNNINKIGNNELKYNINFEKNSNCINLISDLYETIKIYVINFNNNRQDNSNSNYKFFNPYSSLLFSNNCHSITTTLLLRIENVYSYLIDNYSFYLENINKDPYNIISQRVKVILDNKKRKKLKNELELKRLKDNENNKHIILKSKKIVIKNKRMPVIKS